MQRLLRFCLVLPALVSVLDVPGLAQAGVFRVSTSYDSKDAPSTYNFPGFNGGLRQQILVAESRIAALRGKKLTGIWIRRNLNDSDALIGGSVDLEIRVGRATGSPATASPAFIRNLPASPVLTFKGRILVPHSPALGSSPSPWASANSVQIVFNQPFDYQGGDLCIDVTGRPVAGAAPEFWFIDYESSNHSGNGMPIGKSCSQFSDTSGQSLYTQDDWLQIGSTMRLMAFGRPGSSPVLLLGAGRNPNGGNLSMMGAPGCHQHITFFQVARLAYGKVKFGGAVTVHFETQIPANKNLLGMRVFTQLADDERALPAAERSNQAGLTTSNGLELTISSLSPDLGMSIVTSRVVDAATPMPSTGRVDVSMGPVLRILY